MEARGMPSGTAEGQAKSPPLPSPSSSVPRQSESSVGALLALCEHIQDIQRTCAMRARFRSNMESALNSHTDMYTARCGVCVRPGTV